MCLVSKHKLWHPLCYCPSALIPNPAGRRAGRSPRSSGGCASRRCLCPGRQPQTQPSPESEVLFPVLKGLFGSSAEASPAAISHEPPVNHSPWTHPIPTETLTPGPLGPGAAAAAVACIEGVWSGGRGGIPARVRVRVRVRVRLYVRFQGGAYRPWVVVWPSTCQAPQLWSGPGTQGQGQG